MRSPAWCPPGYVALADVLTIIATELEAGKPLNRFPDPKPTREWAQNTFAELEASLAWDELQAVGVDVGSGSLIAIPSAAWKLQIPRRPDYLGNGQNLSQLGAAFQGMTVHTSIYFGAEVRAAISLYALMTWAGAVELPEPPSIAPKQPGQPAALQPPTQTGLSDWMHGYATACKERGAVVKEEEAIREIRKARACTYREARAAFQALPYPELREGPRTKV